MTVYEKAASLVETDPGAAYDLMSREARDQDYVEQAEEILGKGLQHPAFTAMTNEWKTVEKVLADVQKMSKNIQKGGGGHTEDASLIVAKIVPVLESYAGTVQTVAKQLKRRLG